MRRAEGRRGWRRFLAGELGLAAAVGATAFKLAIAYFVIVGLGFSSW